MKRQLAILLVTSIGLAAAPRAEAVPYPSAVRNTGGTTWEFVLNESADNVTILRNGGNAVDLGALAPGRHTFSMAGFNTFDIKVAKNAPEAWTAISGDGSNLFTRYEQPSGLAVNKDPASPYFGTVYVGNARNLSTAEAGGGTIPARAMSDGIYALTADLQGVDLSNFSAVADPQDTTQAKAPNWLLDTSSGGTTGGRSPWRFSLDEAGNLIVADWAAFSGGLKWASPNLTEGGRLLYGDNGDSTVGITNELGEWIHGTISSKPNVTGTLGVDLTVSAVDAVLEAAPGSAALDGQNIWRWNLGNHDPRTQGEYQGVPEMVIDAASLGGSGIWITFVANVSVDAHYSPQHDLWYLTQPRSNGSEPSLLVVRAPAGSPTAPEILFNSEQFSIDNELDGYVDFTGAAGSGVQDIFRMSGTVELSPDGSELYLRRRQVIGTAAGTGTNENPVLGPSSNNPHSVFVIPLDENGLPVLTINDMGTPETKADDRLTDLDGFSIAAPGSSPGNHEIELDAAGNVYTTSNSSELLQVFSPGGNTLATFSWNGTTSSFDVQTAPPGLAGDFDGNGFVDGADFLTWQRGYGTTFDAGDLDDWKANYGTGTPPAAAAAAAVPEPSALLVALTALAPLAALALARRQRSLAPAAVARR